MPSAPAAQAPPPTAARPHLALSRGSIMFLLWKLLKRSRRMLPSGCGAQEGDTGGVSAGRGFTGTRPPAISPPAKTPLALHSWVRGANPGPASQLGFEKP